MQGMELAATLLGVPRELTELSKRIKKRLTLQSQERRTLANSLMKSNVLTIFCAITLVALSVKVRHNDDGLMHESLMQVGTKTATIWDKQSAKPYARILEKFLRGQVIVRQSHHYGYVTFANDLADRLVFRYRLGTPFSAAFSSTFGAVPEGGQLILTGLVHNIQVSRVEGPGKVQTAIVPVTEDVRHLIYQLVRKPGYLIKEMVNFRKEHHCYTFFTVIGGKEVPSSVICGSKAKQINRYLQHGEQGIIRGILVQRGKFLIIRGHTESGEFVRVAKPVKMRIVLWAGQHWLPFKNQVRIFSNEHFIYVHVFDHEGNKHFKAVLRESPLGQRLIAAFNVFYYKQIYLLQGDQIIQDIYHGHVWSSEVLQLTADRLAVLQELAQQKYYAIPAKVRFDKEDECHRFERKAHGKWELCRKVCGDKRNHVSLVLGSIVKGSLRVVGKKFVLVGVDDNGSVQYHAEFISRKAIRILFGRLRSRLSIVGGNIVSNGVSERAKEDEDEDDN